MSDPVHEPGWVMKWWFVQLHTPYSSLRAGCKLDSFSVLWLYDLGFWNFPLARARVLTLAYVLLHELGHLYCLKNSRLQRNSQEPELYVRHWKHREKFAFFHRWLQFQMRVNYSSRNQTRMWNIYIWLATWTLYKLQCPWISMPLVSKKSRSEYSELPPSHPKWL